MLFRSDGTSVDYQISGLPDEEQLQCFMWSQLDGCTTFETDDDVYAGVSAACMWQLSSNPDSREMIALMDSSLIRPLQYRLASGTPEEHRERLVW